MRSLLRGAALAVLCSLAAVATTGPNGSTTSLTVLNANGNTSTCTTNSCAQLTFDSGSPAATIFSGADAKVQSVGIQVTGTWTGTLTFQYSDDQGATWVNLPSFPAPYAGQGSLTSTTANGNFLAPVAGHTSFRAVISASPTGTAVVALTAYVAPVSVGISALPNSQRVSYDLTNTITVPTSAQSLAAVEADTTNRLRLRYIKICLTTALQTTAGERQIGLFRSTAASSGGSTATPSVLDAGDAAFGGVARTGAITTTPAVGSVTQALLLWSGTIFMPAAATTAVPCIEKHFDQGGVKVPSAAAGVANGLAIADLTGGAGGTGNYVVDMHFTTEAN